MTKRKRSSEISADEKSRNFSGKGKILEIFLRVRNFFENRGESETEGENASWSQRGMDAPVEHQTIIIIMITDARGQAHVDAEGSKTCISVWTSQMDAPYMIFRKRIFADQRRCFF